MSDKTTTTLLLEHLINLLNIVTKYKGILEVKKYIKNKKTDYFEFLYTPTEEIYELLFRVMVNKVINKDGEKYEYQDYDIDKHLIDKHINKLESKVSLKT